MKTPLVRVIALGCSALALTSALRAQNAPRPAETVTLAKETVTLTAFEVSTGPEPNGRQLDGPSPSVSFFT